MRSASSSCPRACNTSAIFPIVMASLLGFPSRRWRGISTSRQWVRASSKSPRSNSNLPSSSTGVTRSSSGASGCCASQARISATRRLRSAIERLSTAPWPLGESAAIGISTLWRGWAPGAAAGRNAYTPLRQAQRSGALREARAIASPSSQNTKRARASAARRSRRTLNASQRAASNQPGRPITCTTAAWRALFTSRASSIVTSAILSLSGSRSLRKPARCSTRSRAAITCRRTPSSGASTSSH